MRHRLNSPLRPAGRRETYPGTSCRLPRPGTTMAAGMAAAAATTLRLPVSSVVLVILLLGSSAMMPIVILAAVIAFIVSERLPAGSAMA
ncbi:chloride channel protein [Streptomyces sp. 21So2-11]|uniref:chloride channel protein n=1 Tax=Streptomyces sp. 21So2-11 TaxID=3144408 RepID=UPI00321B6F5E